MVDFPKREEKEKPFSKMNLYELAEQLEIHSKKLGLLRGLDEPQANKVETKLKEIKSHIVSANPRARKFISMLVDALTVIGQNSKDIVSSEVGSHFPGPENIPLNKALNLARELRPKIFQK